MSEVDVETAAGIVTSVMTTRSVKDPGRRLGEGNRGIERQTLSKCKDVRHVFPRSATIL